MNGTMKERTLTTKQKIDIINEIYSKNDIYEEIQKHRKQALKCPCLYDKAEKDYKHKDVKKQNKIKQKQNRMESNRGKVGNRRGIR